MSRRPLRLRTARASETQQLAAALADIAVPGDLLRAGRRDGRRQDGVRPGLRPRASASPSGSPAPRSPSCASTPAGASPCTTSTCTGSTSSARWPTSALSEMLDEEAVMLVEWGDAVLPALPRPVPGAADHLRRRRRRAPPRAPRRRRHLAGPRSACVAEAVAPWRADAAGRRPAVLILGLESATAQVGCAIGGHEGVLASSHSARGKRHAENLTPAIEFVCRQARVELSEISCVAVDNGPGLFTGLRVGVASGKAIAQALRVPMIAVSSLDLLAFPLRFTDRRIAAVIDARRGEVFWAFYRQVPGGIQRVSEPTVGSARRARRRAAGPARRHAAGRRRRRPLRRRAVATGPASRSPAATTPTRRPARWCSSPTPRRSARTGSARARSSCCTCASPTPRSTGPIREGA